MGSVAARRVVTYLRERVALDPKSHGGNLKGQLREFWRLRVGNYRILGRIEDDLLLVLVVHVGHRSVIFEKNRLDQCDGQNGSYATVPYPALNGLFHRHLFQKDPVVLAGWSKSTTSSY